VIRGLVSLWAGTTELGHQLRQPASFASSVSNDMWCCCRSSTCMVGVAWTASDSLVASSMYADQLDRSGVVEVVGHRHGAALLAARTASLLACGTLVVRSLHRAPACAYRSAWVHAPCMHNGVKSSLVASSTRPPGPGIGPSCVRRRKE